MLQIDGLLGAQKFVDVVSDRIERVAKDRDHQATSETAVFRTLEII
jgi:hypothetical protein